MVYVTADVPEREAGNGDGDCEGFGRQVDPDADDADLDELRSVS